MKESCENCYWYDEETCICKNILDVRARYDERLRETDYCSAWRRMLPEDED